MSILLTNVIASVLSGAVFSGEVEGREAISNMITEIASSA
jgi:hypothetical protein